MKREDKMKHKIAAALALTTAFAFPVAASADALETLEGCT